MSRRGTQGVVLGLLCLVLCACSDVGYYAQCVRGQVGLWMRCRPIEKVLADPQTPATLQDRLQTVLEARDFASSQLALPQNQSYRLYADLERPYVVWNVVAAQEFSLEPRRWCFPVAGCVSYRGYYEEKAARRYAQTLRSQGLDVFVYGVRAYSTLGWFDDPVLNTFVHDGDALLAGTIFHELAHQVYYLKGHTTFNESFASVVEREGVRRWLRARGRGEDLLILDRGGESLSRFLSRVNEARDALRRLYGSGLAQSEIRREKQSIFSRLESQLADLGDEGALGGWKDRSLNNASLVLLQEYTALAPRFEALLQECGGDMEVFYRRVGEMGARWPLRASR